MKRLLFTLAVITSLVSCKKSSPAPAGCVVNAGNIAGKYIITAISYKEGSNTTDLFASLNDCQKDDSYLLNENGTVTISEEANDCGLPPMPGSPETWSLDKNNSVLVMGENLDIQSFNCKELVVTQKNILTDGDLKTTTYTKVQ